MKLKEGMMLHTVNGEHMAIATGKAAQAFRGLVRNNETADFICQKLLKETTPEEIAKALCEEYDVTPEKALADVKALAAKLDAAGFRVEMDARNEKIGYRIREAQLDKVPYMLILGDKEKEEQNISVRDRRDGKTSVCSVEEFIQSMHQQIAEKK